ncbi:cupin domain-containing protein [Haloplasma contractile]|uniref:Uncharacterized protein n=1 Tax=Haloplasma contractile SSD-17B TaxID=1033810 RepID=F7PRN7_9MOLU|nr:hypothetical protein [Haloplasma contractile]ERJ11883.1 hypothetical protein HLPCO_002123 [Haloplasma contractile SSD-17B]
MKYEILSYDEVGYKPVVSFNGWRVAMLNYIDELEPDRIDNFQKHDLTDESFILLEGECILFVADVDGDSIQNIEAIEMEKNKVYNIKKSVYHTHTLKKGTRVLIVENDDTSDENSPIVSVTESVTKELVRLTNKYWSSY